MRQLVANRADDGARHAAHHVRLVAHLADLVEDGGLVLLRNVRFENDNHFGNLCMKCVEKARTKTATLRAENQPAIARSRERGCVCPPQPCDYLGLLNFTLNASRPLCHNPCRIASATR